MRSHNRGKRREDVGRKMLGGVGGGGGGSEGAGRARVNKCQTISAGPWKDDSVRDIKRILGEKIRQEKEKKKNEGEMR